jgi:Flp pilus assembly protein TadG
MPASQNRRGAILLAGVFLMLFLMAVLAFGTDVTRMFTMRNQLHTGSDAAALAGVVQLVRTPGDPTAVTNAAIAYGGQNSVFNDQITISAGDVVLGNWTPATAAWTPGGTPTNAVQVTSRKTTRWLAAQMLGMPHRQIVARSIAYASPTIEDTDCIKPWAIPYRLLTMLLDPTGDPDRDLTPADLAALATMTPEQLSFTLKDGAPAQGEGTGLPGNFYAVEILGPGADLYQQAIATCAGRTLGPGDTLWTQPGNIAGPTIDGSGDLCNPLAGGVCFNSEGGVGVPV